MKTFIVTIIYLAANFHPANTLWVKKLEDQLHVKIKIDRVIDAEDPFPNENTSDTFFNKYGHIKEWVKNGPYHPNQLTLVILPPVIYPFTKGLEGLAQVCQLNDGVALVWAIPKTTARYADQLAIAHEMGHLLGANHDQHIYGDGASLMHGSSASQALIHPNMHFSAQSIREIRNCIGG